MKDYCHVIYIPYSRKFSQFMQSNASSRKFVPMKFLADKLRKLSTLSSSHKSRNSTKSTYFVISIEQTVINSPIIIAAANGSSELVHSLWHSSFFHRQRLTWLSFRCDIQFPEGSLFSCREIVGSVVRHSVTLS